ncbi:MAG: 4-hydroxythreonine-4-phosphate dehydrogenase PdxA [Bacteroidota bacterium]
MENHKEGHKIRLGISIGDLNGIGGEVALKSFVDDRMLDFCTPILFASNKTISEQKRALGLQINFNGVKQASHAIAGKVNVVNIWKETPKTEYGLATPEAGKFAILSLKAAVSALKNNEIDVLVTAPINKKNIQSETFNFPGHTDYLAKELNGTSLMLMVSETIKVGLLTDHIAVKDVAKTITTKLIRDKVFLLKTTLIQDFGIRKPKIALLGINPHSGDNGTIGQEDDQIVKPAIAELHNEGHLVYGPYASDGFFGSGTYLNFDGILAAYHDQGLIPFKTLSFGKGVNFTAGLSKIRTSPDHGTAYEIAGKGIADESSFKEAIFTAIKVFRKRMEYGEITQNPLKKQSIKRSA